MTAANTHVPMSNGNDASLHLQSSSVPTTTSAPDVFSIPRRASLAAPSSPATTARSARCTDGTGTVEHGVDSAGPGGWWPVDSEQGRHRLPGHSRLGRRCRQVVLSRLCSALLECGVYKKSERESSPRSCRCRKKHFFTFNRRQRALCLLSRPTRVWKFTVRPLLLLTACVAQLSKKSTLPRIWPRRHGHARLRCLQWGKTGEKASFDLPIDQRVGQTSVTAAADQGRTHNAPRPDKTSTNSFMCPYSS